MDGWMDCHFNKRLLNGAHSHSLDCKSRDLEGLCPETDSCWFPMLPSLRHSEGGSSVWRLFASQALTLSHPRQEQGKHCLCLKRIWSEQNWLCPGQSRLNDELKHHSPGAPPTAARIAPQLCSDTLSPKLCTFLSLPVPKNHPLVCSLLWMYESHSRCGTQESSYWMKGQGKAVKTPTAGLRTKKEMTLFYSWFHFS